MASLHRTCRALVDRELYLPQAWPGDRDRCRQAGVPGTGALVDSFPRRRSGMITTATILPSHCFSCAW
jgi:hypothetical protein